MLTFEIKTYSTDFSSEKPHFFILNKGLNSGKPLKTPCPNCFAILLDTNQEQEFVYWLIYGLWRSKMFYPYHRGSVIPFVIKKDFIDVIQGAIAKASKNMTVNISSIEKLKLIEQKEQELLKILKNLNILKRALFQHLN